MTTSPGRVVVIGNGPVGQSTALLLARWGVPVTVVDERPARELVGSKSICQHRDVLDVWDSVGVGSTIAEEGVTWTTARTFYRDAELFSVEFHDAGQSPFPPFVNISQCRTEEVMDEQIAHTPSVDVRWGHRVTDLTQDEAGVTVHCETTDGPTSLSAAYVVACPGGHGDVVRNALGVTFEGETFGDQFLICDIRTDLPGWERERRFYFDPEWNPDRQVLIHPCPDSTFRIDWQVPESFDLAEEERTGALDRRVRQVIGDRDHEIVWTSVYRFHSRLVDRMRSGRVLLAGDGAHLMAPFGARGLNSGVQDAENAAWKIAFVLCGWAPEPLLESYHAERHAAALENLDVTGATMEFLVPHDEHARQVRRRTLAAARTDPGARARVDSGRLAEPFWYVDSPLTTPDPTRPFAGRPPRGEVPTPGPGILVPDLPLDPPADGATRVRQVLREGVTVLIGPDVDPELVRPVEASVTAPVEVRDLAGLSPRLAGTLRARPDEAWFVRPDAYVAAVLANPSAAQVRAALARMLGRVPTPGSGGHAT